MTDAAPGRRRPTVRERGQRRRPQAAQSGRRQAGRGAGKPAGRRRGRAGRRQEGADRRGGRGPAAGHRGAVPVGADRPGGTGTGRAAGRLRCERASLRPGAGAGATHEAREQSDASDRRTTRAARAGARRRGPPVRAVFLHVLLVPGTEANAGRLGVAPVGPGGDGAAPGRQPDDRGAAAGRHRFGARRPPRAPRRRRRSDARVASRTGATIECPSGRPSPTEAAGGPERHRPGARAGSRPRASPRRCGVRGKPRTGKAPGGHRPSKGATGTGSAAAAKPEPRAGRRAAGDGAEVAGRNANRAWAADGRRRRARHDHEQEALRMLRPLREQAAAVAERARAAGLRTYRSGNFAAAAKELEAYAR